jgi:hypothetical protein
MAFEVLARGLGGLLWGFHMRSARLLHAVRVCSWHRQCPGRFRPGHASSGKEETMITVEFTEAEAQAIADVIVAWGADDCPVGMIDTRALYTAQGKLGAVIDSQIVKAA